MQKIRIFALAKELNMDSKDLIEACAKVGVILKNSALASISPEEKSKVLDYLKQSSSVSTPAPKAVPVPPVREVVKSFDKPLQNLMAPRPQAPRLSPKPRPGESELEDDSAIAVATAEAPSEPAIQPDSETYTGTPEEETVNTVATTAEETVIDSPADSSSVTATISEPEEAPVAVTAPDV
ncbi:MAG: translation initiation factor IF-2 N-terminal domain-containing protein, partial [Planctomycetota bacterium]